MTSICRLIGRLRHVVGECCIPTTILAVSEPAPMRRASIRRRSTNGISRYRPNRRLLSRPYCQNKSRSAGAAASKPDDASVLSDRGRRRRPSPRSSLSNVPTKEQRSAWPSLRPRATGQAPLESAARLCEPVWQPISFSPAICWRSLSLPISCLTSLAPPPWTWRTSLQTGPSLTPSLQISLGRQCPKS